MRTPDRIITTTLIFLGLVACDSSSKRAAPVTAAAGLRIAGTNSAGGATEGLAHSLLRLTGLSVTGPSGTSFALADKKLREQLWQMVCIHLLYKSFGVGAAPQVGSSRMVRLAGQKSAPVDANSNGTNLDEALNLDLRILAAYAGVPLPPFLKSTSFPWEEGTADFLRPIAPGRPLGADVLEGGYGRVRMRQVGESMLAKLLFAGEMLAFRRGIYVGASPEEGGFGLLLVQQAAAMEETLLAELFFDGEFLGKLNKPGEYDPTKQGAKTLWLPSRFRIEELEGSPGVVKGYRLLDRASSLDAIASIMRASAQLAFLSSPAFPQKDVKKLFGGAPFGFSSPDPGTPSDPDPNKPTVSYTTHVKKILDAKCVSCHSGQFPENGYRCDTYANTLAGGQSTGPNSKNPIIVKGKSKDSLLYKILVGNTAVGERMPWRQTALTSAQIKDIADWIDQNALEKLPPEPEPIKTGVDLARIMLHNLRKLHLRSDGALDHRHEGDEPSGFMDPEATGLTLLALAHATATMPTETAFKTTLSDVATAAAARLIDSQGRVLEGYNLDHNFKHGVGDLTAQAMMTAGVLAAARSLNDPKLDKIGRLAAKTLLDEFFDASADLFRNRPGQMATSYTPQTLQAVFDALRESAMLNDKTIEAGKVLDGFVRRLVPHLAFAEDTIDERLGDGRADTDDNGIREPGLAGGPNGRAPLFVGLLREGPMPTGEEQSRLITWSRDIVPLFQAKCAECHMNGNALGSYRTDSPRSVGTAGESGGKYPLIVPGSPDASLLFDKLKNRKPLIGEQMPQRRPPLDAAGLELVRRWIVEGATRR